MECKLDASPNFHRIAWSRTAAPATIPDMAKGSRNYIRAWRKYRHDMTQKELAARLLEDQAFDLSEASISHLETGQQHYTQPVLEAIATALACAPADLLATDPFRKVEKGEKAEKPAKSATADDLPLLAALAAPLLNRYTKNPELARQMGLALAQLFGAERARGVRPEGLRDYEAYFDVQESRSPESSTA